MRLRPDHGAHIPASEPARLEGFRRRTSIARAGLAAALIGLLALCVVVSRQYDVRHAPLVASGSSGIIVLDLSASVFEGGFEATVRKLVRTDERAGLVVFSDTAYQLLPPGSWSRVPAAASLLPLVDDRVPSAEPVGPLPGGHAHLRGPEGRAGVARARGAARRHAHSSERPRDPSRRDSAARTGPRRPPA